MPEQALQRANDICASSSTPLTADIAADVAVLGGGFTGLSAAYYILSISPHKRVVVLEAKGWGTARRDETAPWC
jgi:cation diffusion facilitator CzcD-associated flavoprotein CzcO